MLLGNLMKSITNMKNIKEEGVQIGGSVAAEALKQAEQYKKYVNEQVVIMRTRLNPIMASTSPKNQAMLDQVSPQSHPPPFPLPLNYSALCFNPGSACIA